MESASLDQSAALLVKELTEHIDDSNGLGFMSPAIYDTAWVSMIKKTDNDQTFWLFPKSFHYILENQLENGGWVTYASEIDGILNTSASLLSLKRHFDLPLQISTESQTSMENRIRKATDALRVLLRTWDVDATLHVGFEILVPALLDYLQVEGLTFDFPGRDKLFQIRDQKLSRFKPEFIYAPFQTTALHSLEAFIGLIDFDRVQHHKVRGSFMASPSSTAAVLMNATEWDIDCEEYIRHVIEHASGKASGGVPSAFPSTIFEITWTLSTLLKAGFNLSSNDSSNVQKACSYLLGVLTAEKGAIGFVPSVCADADDTAKTILVLSLLRENVLPDGMLKAFEVENHFKTYPLERDPSFSANCNVLLALLHLENPSQYTLQIEKATRFLYTHFRESNLNVRDKWNLSPFYSWMLMAQAIARLDELCKGSQLKNLHDHVESDLIPLLQEMTVSVMHQQNKDGSWGTKLSKEETAYAVLMLTYAVSFEALVGPRRQIRNAIEEGCLFLRSGKDATSERLWVEKVTYESQMLSRAYTLAALKNALDVLKKDDMKIAFIGNSVNESFTEIEVVNGKNVTEPSSNTYDLKEVKMDKAEFTPPDTPPRSKSTSVDPIEEAICAHENRGAISDHTSRAIDLCRNPPLWGTDQEQTLLGPFEYLESIPGKNIRSQFIEAFNTWLQIPQDHLQIVGKVISMLHTASLLVDDIEDNSLLRRGQPVAHSIFGTAQTFNSGNYVYFLALQEVQKLNSPRAISIFVDALTQLHRGQGMDVFWRDSLICPTEEEYLDMVANKTGALFCLAIELLQIKSTVQLDFLPLVRLLGIIFQICDDYLNLKSTNYTQKKGLCEDITEGKFSFPIIHSIRTKPGNRQLINVLRQKSKEDDVKRFALAYMESTQSFDYTRDFVKILNGEALRMIEDLEQQGLHRNIEIRNILARMSLEQ